MTVVALVTPSAETERDAETNSQSAAGMGGGTGARNRVDC